MSFRDTRVAKIVPCEDLAFGKWKSEKKYPGLVKSQLHLTIGGDNAVFWLSNRRGHVIQMDYEELMELLSILNNRMPLDALGSI